VIVAAVLAATTLAGCGGHSSGTAPTTTATSTAAASTTTVPEATTTTTAPATTTTTVPRTTTTTVSLPPAPQATPDAAATAFMAAWKDGDRKAAATVATARAITALFAASYKGQSVIDRGCSVKFLPRVCSWGDYGGGSGPLYEIDTRPAGANWYVSNAIIEG
jgi:hypothetical protein